MTKESLRMQTDEQKEECEGYENIWKDCMNEVVLGRNLNLDDGEDRERDGSG